MRVAYIIPGGIGTGKNNIGVPVLERIIRSLAADFDITVFQLFPRNRDFDPAGLHVIDVYSRNRTMRSLKCLVAFYRIHRTRKFQVVHGFWALPCGFLAAVLGKVFDVKSIISLQGGDAISLPEINYGQLQQWIPRKLVLWGLRQAKVVISPTLFLTSSLHKFGFDRRDVKYIPLGVDTSHFTFRDRLINDPVRFLHVANLSPVKDQVTLLKAFQIISNRLSCHLTIIGEGILKDRIMSLARELNIRERITFTGLLPYESLPAYYREADILLHTSLSEGHPIVVEEAMSCGVVVCGTKVGLLYDLPYCCVAVQRGDYRALAEETLKLISDPTRMAAIRQAAFRWAVDHSMKWTVTNFSRLYRR